VHGRDEFEAAVEASAILFGKATTDALKRLDERTLLAVFDGVPQFDVERARVEAGMGIIEFLAVETRVFNSNGEARRMLKDNGVSINKEKVKDSYEIGNKDLLNDTYILAQKGKKNYFLIKVV
jgi:tyrosyl-tRNA synthetase